MPSAIPNFEALANQLGASIFNSPEETEVAAVRDEVFCGGLPRGNATGELALIRLALCCRNVARMVNQPPAAYWVFIRATALDDLVQPYLQTDEHKAEWALLESRIIAVINCEEEFTHA